MSVALATQRPPITQAAWLQAWPLYPLLLFTAGLFVYPVAQFLVLSVTDPSGQRYDCNVKHSLAVHSSQPVLITLVAHSADGGEMRRQQFTLASKRSIVWSL